MFDPLSVPLSVLEELRQLRAQVEQLRQDNERLERENERLRREFVNNVWVHTTEKSLQVFAENNITHELAKANFQEAVDPHNAEETPLFAKSIERKAIGLKR